MKICKIIVGILGIGAACYVGWNTGKCTYKVIDGVLDKLEYEDNDSLGCELGKMAIGATAGVVVTNCIANGVAEIIS